MKVKEESGKAGVKLNIQKMKIIASVAITSWQIDGETMETVTDFIFLGSKITADGDYSHQIQTFGLLGEGEGGMFQENSIETCILSRVKEITSPGWMHETSARTWCTGKT